MMENIKISYLLLLLVSLFLLPTCKSDKTTTELNSTTSSHSSILESQKKEAPKSVQEKKVIDSVTSKTQAPKEVKKENPIPKKDAKRPIEQKPQAATKKKKAPKKYSKKKPKIQFDELTWDFGEITEGDIVEKKFKFTNTGNAPLQILATSATCGCTRPSFPFLDIAPGESNVIGVTYNSVGKDGKQDPEVTIESNTNPRVTVIKLHGTVIPKPNTEKRDSLTSSKDTLTTNRH